MNGTPSNDRELSLESQPALQGKIVDFYFPGTLLILLSQALRDSTLSGIYTALWIKQAVSRFQMLPDLQSKHLVHFPANQSSVRPRKGRITGANELHK